MNLMIIFFASLSFSIFFTPYLITYLISAGVVDKPEKRRINKRIIPRMGGIILYAALTIVTFFFYEDINSIRLIIFSALLIVICGIIDDIYGMKWFVKFPIQFLAAVLVVLHFSGQFSAVKLFGLVLPYPLDIITIIFFIAGVLNAINMMDGLDGLVSGYSLVIFSLILVLSIIKTDFFLIITVLTLLGSILGFLKFNSFPAKIFLGDTGSLLLGFYIVVTSLKVTLNYFDNILDLTFPIILLAIPIVDTLRVMTQRILARTNPFLPDNTHLHHLILRNNIRHKMSVFFILGLSLLFVFISLDYLKYGRAFSIVLFIFGSLLIIFIQPVLLNVMKINYITKIFAKLHKYPFVIYHFFDKYMVYASIPLVLVIIFRNFPMTNVSSLLDLYALSLAGVIIFLLSWLHYKRTKILNSIYVYFNICFFLFFNYLAHPFEEVFSIYYGYNNILSGAIIALITIIEIFFLIIRAITSNRKDMFLSGMDLTLIVITELVFVLLYFSNTNYLLAISCNLLLSFIIYLMYKIIVYIKSSMAKPVYFLSFLLPFSVMVYAFFHR